MVVIIKVVIHMWGIEQLLEVVDKWNYMEYFLIYDMKVFWLYHYPLSLLMLQFPTVSHPQTLERRYLGIIDAALLDLLKVRRAERI